MPTIAKRFTAGLFCAIAMCLMSNAYALDPKFVPKDNRTDVEKNMDRAGKANEQRQKEIQRQKDDPHSNRYSVGKDTSVAPSFDPPGVNIKKTTK